VGTVIARFSPTSRSAGAKREHLLPNPALNTDVPPAGFAQQRAAG
jgi:hypothetical protein